MRQYRELVSSLTRPLPLTIAALAAAGILAGNSKLPAFSKKPQSRPAATTNKVGPASETAALRQSGYSSLPLSFEPNVGQVDDDVRFVSRGPGYSLFLTADQAVMVLRSRPQTNKHELPKPDAEPPAVVRMKVVGANTAVPARGEQLQRSYTNYLLGSDASKWHTQVPNYGRVAYSGVYPGVDLVYYGNQRQLEYDFVVQPGADASRIQLAFEGADKLRLDQGDLVLSVRGREVRQHKPVVYQEVAGRRVPVASGYELLADNRQVRFSVANYDHRRPLIIDPTISYGTYLGGSGDDLAFGIAIDQTTPTAVYVTGDSTTTTAPSNTVGPLSGGLDAFVTKLNVSSTGASSLVFTTYFGGGALDIGNGVKADSTGIYVVGSTNSTNFPTVSPVQANNAGGFDAFIGKLNTTGTAFLYSTYFGGVGTEFDFSIAVVNGSAYTVGQTDSANLTSGSPAVVQAQNAGGTDAFVTRLKSTGALGFSTYLGGSGEDHGYGIAVDSSNNVYVVGDTNSSAFSAINAISGTFNGTAYNGGVYRGNTDAFAVKITQTQDGSGNTTGLGVAYSTYLGGTGQDDAYDVSVDTSGNAYVIGQTNSTNFPVTTGAAQPASGGGFDAFVAKIPTTGTTLTYSTYLGGAGDDAGQSIWVNSTGFAYIAGNTSSSNFPTGLSQQSIPQSTFGGVQDAFIGKLAVNATSLVYLTYYGGSQSDSAAGIVADNNGNAYVAGSTSSTNLPGTSNGYRTFFQGGNSDGYMVALSEGATQNATSVQPTSLSYQATQGQGTAPNQNLALTGSASTTYIVTTSVQGQFANFLSVVSPTTFPTTIGANPNVVIGLNTTVTSTLSPGTYAGTVTITTSLGEVINVPVTLQITSTTTGLTTSAAVALYNTGVQYTLNPLTPTNTPQTQTQTITLNSPGPTTYMTTVATSGPNFVTVSPASGSTTGTPGTAAVDILTNPTGLPAGTYTATVTFSSPSYTSTVYRVTLYIENPTVSTTEVARPAKVGIFRQFPQGNNGVLALLDKNGDATCCSGDSFIFIGQVGDIPLVGDWTGDGVQKIGIFRPFGAANGAGLFILDYNNNGQYDAGVDKVFTLPASQAIPAVLAGDVPVVGDWTGTGVERVGLFRPALGTFFEDVNGDGSFTGRAFLGTTGDIPVVGNWNGVGKQSKVGIYRPSAGFFLVDYDGDGLYRPNGSTVDPPPFFLGQSGDVPVVGDWNGDGKSKLGIFRASIGLFILDYNGNYNFDGPSVDRALFLSGATAGDQPVVGNWVPSYLGPSSVQGRSRVGVFRPGLDTWYLDVNGDGSFVGRAYLGATGDVGLSGNF